MTKISEYFGNESEAVQKNEYKLDEMTFVKFDTLEGQTVKIEDCIFYSKDGVDKVIMILAGNQYTITSSKVVVKKLREIRGKIPANDNWNLEAKVTPRASKTTGRKYFDLF